MGAVRARVAPWRAFLSPVGGSVTLCLSDGPSFFPAVSLAPSFEVAALNGSGACHLSPSFHVFSAAFFSVFRPESCNINRLYRRSPNTLFLVFELQEAFALIYFLLYSLILPLETQLQSQPCKEIPSVM